jgi:F-type H+-transporting ATPase subunit b
MFQLAVDFSPIKPDFGLLFWTLLIFLLFWGIIGKFAFGPIRSALSKREKDIQDALDQAKMAREEIANMKSENVALLAEAREERTQILQQAKENKNAIIAEAKEKAKEEAQKIVSNAKNDIENEKKAALIEIKNSVGSMALEIAEKVIRKELQGDKEQTSFVDKLVDDFKLN